MLTVKYVTTTCAVASLFRSYVHRRFNKGDDWVTDVTPTPTGGEGAPVAPGRTTGAARAA